MSHQLVVGVDFRDRTQPLRKPQHVPVGDLLQFVVCGIRDSVTVKRQSLFIPRTKSQRRGGNDREAGLARPQRKITNHIGRLNLVEYGHGTGDECHDVFANLRRAGQVNASESAVQPPLVLGRLDALPIAGDLVQIRAFDDDGQVRGHTLLDPKAIADLEAAVGWERAADDLVTELHAIVPRVFRPAVVLVYASRRVVAIDRSLRLAADR